MFVTFCPSAGAGAVYGNDGYQCCATGSTLGNIGKTNIEDEMLRFPWEYIHYEFVSDNEGAGRWRGVPGIRWAVENHSTGRCMHQTGSWDGFKTQAQGCQGGEGTHFNQGGVRRTDGSYEAFAQKDLFTMPGDIIETVTSGSAGVGLLSQRDPQAVREDVINELVSVERA